MDGRITHVRPGWAVYEEAGHTAEGALTVTEEGVNFDGHFVCGPHDAHGGHVHGENCGACHRCLNGQSLGYILCPDCGNKRCPKANDHRNECTASNASGQPGSAYA